MSNNNNDDDKGDNTVIVQCMSSMLVLSSAGAGCYGGKFYLSTVGAKRVFQGAPQRWAESPLELDSAGC